jgi:Xaa-Pro aminopeptidase
MVITLEIGTYVNGFAAFQIEDEILVTDDGYELLTSLTWELVEL